MNRIDEALAEDRDGGTASEYYGDPSEYPDCPMPDWLKRRLGLPPDDRLIGEAAAAMRAASMGSRTVPTIEEVRRGLADGAGAAAVFAALSSWLAGRSPHQMMAGWARGLYTPRQAVAKAVEHGIRIPGLRDQLRCVRACGSAAPGGSVRWNIEPEEPIVKLPEPARTLYLRERDLIAAWTAGAGLAAEQVALGGGSVLGARWGHRDSDDIDVVLQGGTAYAEMLSARETLEALAESRGGTVSWVPQVQAVRINWSNRDLGTNVKLEFFAEAESPPGHAERIVELEGRPTRTLGTRQILWGKLERSLRVGIAKDIFDIREAARRDPEALAAAVNAWPGSAMRDLAQAFRSNAAAAGKLIEKELRTTVAIEPGAGRIVAEEAGNAIERALYREVTVGVEKGLVRVDRVTAAGPLPPLRWPADETAVEAERTGMARHLDANGISLVLNDAASVAGRSAGAAAIWTARDGETVMW
ncbi:MAG: nucleotidyl transferase AbiEii/AbiGii toxin family protein, partial [Rhodospirillales bacterium]|nr:nucleotidyl transferase AbiEii/AbiGii toxin family protein [Rhodospirillales bacterium]